MAHAALPANERADNVRADNEKVDWVKSIPFLLMHLAPLGALWTGFTWGDVVLCVALYVARMFFITAGYHRYFSHRSYRLGRVMQFLMAFGGATAVQKGPLWWAVHHRTHHRLSDTPDDPHASHRGFWWSHVTWILCNKYDDTPEEKIKDFARFPELRWLNRYHLVAPLLLAVACYAWGGGGGLFIGFFLSTVLLWHGTFSINSLTHRWGNRRYDTSDTSKNSFLLALITLGEGWHNNHHYYQSTANQGFFWWEVDISYYVLKAMSWVGLAHDLRTPSNRARFKNWLDQDACERALARRGLQAPEPHVHEPASAPAE